MYKTITCLALSILASFTAACVSTTVDEDLDEERAEELDLDSSAEAAPGDNAPSAKQGGTAELTCPSVATCVKAQHQCFYYDRLCDVASVCDFCYGPIEPAAPGAESARANQGETAELTCPGAGTCAKADYNCFEYGTMCDVAARCEQCYGPAASDE